MLRIIAILAILAITISTASGCSREPDPLEIALQHADSLVAAAVESGISGAVLLVSKGGEVRHLGAHGMARQYEFGGAESDAAVPMRVDQVFDLASLTKVFATTFGIMMLVDAGHVDLDAPVYAYLPAFSSPGKDSITVRHLLTHTAGLYPWKPVYYHASNREEAFEYISRLGLAYPVGAARHYSDLGFMLLGYLIEEVAGLPMDVFLMQNLYGRLGLEHTGFNPSTANPDAFAATSHGNPFERRMVADDDFGYVCDEDPEDFTDWRERVFIGEVNDGNAYHAHGGLAGHAGLFSTAIELYTLLQLLLDRGEFEDRQIISEAVIAKFLTPDVTGNGLGWAMSPAALVLDEAPAGAFGHTGFTGTYALAIPSQDLAVILLTNRQHAGVDPDGRYPSVNELRRGVVETLLGRLE